MTRCERGHPRSLAPAPALAHTLVLTLAPTLQNSTELVMRTLNNTERVYKNKTSSAVRAITFTLAPILTQTLNLTVRVYKKEHDELGGVRLTLTLRTR